MDDLLLEIEAVLWSSKVDDLPPLLILGVKLVRFIYAIIRDVLTTTLTLRAMGLVYITILSVVPMLALVFAGLKGLVSIGPTLSQRSATCSRHLATRA